MIWKTSRENNITRDVKLNASLSRGFYYRLNGHWQAGFPHYCRLLPGAPYTPRSQHINLTQGCTYRLGLELPYHMNCTRMTWATGVLVRTRFASTSVLVNLTPIFESFTAGSLRRIVSHACPYNQVVVWVGLTSSSYQSARNSDHHSSITRVIVGLPELNRSIINQKKDCTRESRNNRSGHNRS